MITFKNKDIMLFLVEKIHELQGTPCPDLDFLPQEYVEKMYQNEFSEKFLTDLLTSVLSRIMVACKNELKLINDQQRFLDLFFNGSIKQPKTLQNKAEADIDALILLWEFNHSMSHDNEANINFLRSRITFLDDDRLMQGGPGNLASTEFQKSFFTKTLDTETRDARRKYRVNALISYLWSSVGFTVIADGFPADSMVTDSFKLCFNTFCDLAKHFPPAVTVLLASETV